MTETNETEITEEITEAPDTQADVKQIKPTKDGKFEVFLSDGTSYLTKTKRFPASLLNQVNRRLKSKTKTLSYSEEASGLPAATSSNPNKKNRSI